MSASSIIFSPQDDINAAAACWALAKSGHQALWAKSGSYADAVLGGLSFQLDELGPLMLRGALNSPQLRSVWYRRAKPAQEFAKVRACDQGFLQDQWLFFQRNLDQLGPSLSPALWINSPMAARFGENKLHQLEIARRCGFTVPATLVSNDPEHIAAFRKRYPQVIYKTFSPHTWLQQASSSEENPSTARAFVAHARMLDSSMEIDPRSLALCPGIFQAFVHKKTDLRVTVIGERQFVMQLNSSSGVAFVDWRSHAEDADFQAQIAQISASTREHIQALMRTLNIVYGCVDLVLDHNQQVHFLEVNQGGQFLFAERWLPELPLLRAMSAMLASGRVDYQLDDVAPLTYAEFLASEDCQQWRAEGAALMQKHNEPEPFLSVEVA
jgi:hypothetical protein